MKPAPLLAIAELLCGAHIRRNVFEPLIADWQRELGETAGQRYARAFMSGATAFLVALVRSSLTGGSWMPAPRAAGAGVLAFLVAIDAGAFLLLILAVKTGRTIDVGSIQSQFYLLSTLSVIMAAGALPALYMARRDSRSTTCHAVVIIVAVTVLTAVTVEMTTQSALRERFTSFEAFEREYQRNLANDRAGRYQYPGTAVRQLRGPTTVAERRDAYQRFEAWRRQHSSPPPPVSGRQRFTRHQPTLMALLLGVMGWTLAGLGPPLLRRAWLWWVLMLAAILTSNGTVSQALRSSARPPSWASLAVVLTVTLVMAAYSWRPRSGRQS